MAMLTVCGHESCIPILLAQLSDSPEALACAEGNSRIHDFRHPWRGFDVDTMGGTMRVGWHFKVAGFIGWLAVAVPAFADIAAGHMRGPRAVLWTVAFAAFGATYAAYLRPHAHTSERRGAVWSIVALTAAALTMVVTSIGLMKYLASVTLTIVAGELPYLLSRPAVWMWVTVQSVGLAVIFWYSFGWVSGLAGGSAYAGFQIFALGRAWSEQRERQARQELARANADLRATHSLYAESSRVAERLRISRDLHDSLGHHLTALSLQLDVAARTSAGPAAQQ